MKTITRIMDLVAVVGVTLIAVIVFLAYNSPEIVGPLICDLTTDTAFDYTSCRIQQTL